MRQETYLTEEHVVPLFGLCGQQVQGKKPDKLYNFASSKCTTVNGSDPF